MTPKLVFNRSFWLWFALYLILRGLDHLTTFLALSYFNLTEGNLGYGWWSLPLGVLLSFAVALLASTFENYMGPKHALGANLLRVIYGFALLLPVLHNVYVMWRSISG